MKVILVLIALGCFGCSSPVSITEQTPYESLMAVDIDEAYGDILTQNQNGDHIIIYSMNRNVDMNHRARVGSKILVGHRGPNRLVCIGNPEKEFDCAVVGGHYQKRLWKDADASGYNPAGQKQLFPPNKIIEKKKH